MMSKFLGIYYENNPFSIIFAANFVNLRSRTICLKTSGLKRA